MPYELKSARYLARDALLQAVNAGDTVVDATMGNGHDTLFLAEQVGPEGHVCAFDIQESALESTRALLEAHHAADRVTLFCQSHAELAGSVPAGIAAAVFNLGWLPGGDHTVTTRTASTRQAVLAALELLKPGGIVTICAYVSVWRVLCKETKLKLLQNAMQESKSRFPKKIALSIAIKQQKGEV